MKYEFNQCIGTRLRRLARIADGQYRSQLSEFGITENQLTILFVLTSKGKIDQGKIGEILLLQRSTVSRNIKVLEKLKLVKKSKDYRPTVETTAKGQKLVEKLIPLWEKTMDALTDTIGEDGLKALKTLETKLL